jgi:hypothetical protein
MEDMNKKEFKKRERQTDENISNLFIYKPRAKKISKEISDYLKRR